MVANFRRSGSVLSHAAALFLVIGLCACHTMAPDPAADIRRQLPPGTNTEGYLLATSNDGTQTSASLSNPAAQGVIRMSNQDTRVPLGFTRITDNKTNTSRLYRTEIVRRDNRLNLTVTDVVSAEVLLDRGFPPPQPHAGPTFDTLEACIADFNCKHQGALQCEANRTCEPQFAALTCCLTNGQCFSVHMVYPPTSPRCRLRDIVVDFEGLALSSNP